MKTTCGLLIFLWMSFNLASAQVKFVIESLPETTPANDSIFISGTFNDWNTADPKYLLSKQPNGKLAISLTFDLPVVEYKFTRGDWLKVETGKTNEYIPNRVFKDIEPAAEISVRIQNWQDLGGARSFEYLTFYYFAIAILALLLAVISIRIFKKDPDKRIVFGTTNLFLMCMFLGVVTFYIVNPIWQTYAVIISQVIVFVWGPLLYLYLKCIGTKQKIIIKKSYFVPVSIAIPFAILQWLNLESFTLLTQTLIGNLSFLKLFLFGSGGLVLIYFLLRFTLKESWAYPHLAILQRIYLYTFILINITGVLMILLGLFQEYAGAINISFNGFKLFFVIISVLVWLEVLVIWQDPQFFRDKPQIAPIISDNLLLDKLKHSMEKEMAFCQPELNVNKLAEILDTKPHILSKLLNEHYGQNFRDFVNTFRVNYFIKQAHEGKLDQLTYLGLAHEVGFNSKSTFNLAFKKITGQNPREYFKTYAV